MARFRTNLYQRGAGGIPATTWRMPLPVPTSLEWTIAAVGGFESLRYSFKTDVQSALWWMQRVLLGSISVSDKDAFICWEGFVNSIDVRIGQEQRSLSLDPVINAIKARFTTPNGVPGASPSLSTFTSNTTSQAIYGTKHGIISTDAKTLTEAGYAAATKLALYAFPRAQPTSTIATGALGEVEVVLNCVGWYYALDWLTLSSTTSSTSATETQIAALITGYNAINNFFNTATGGIVVTGRSPSQLVDLDTTYRSRFETLLSFGNSSDQRLVGGVYKDRKFIVKAWAGATPTVATYRRSVRGMDLLDTNRCRVDLWKARPDAMYEVREFLGFETTNVDTGGRYYVERIHFRIDQNGMTLDLEPEASNSLDVILTRFSAGIR